MQDQNTATSRWGREVAVAKVVAFETARGRGESQRSFAQAEGVPRTTLQYWQARKHKLDSSPVLREFFESPDGLAFLHRLVMAIEFVVRFVIGGGRRAVQRIFRLVFDSSRAKTRGGGT